MQAVSSALMAGSRIGCLHQRRMGQGPNCSSSRRRARGGGPGVLASSGGFKTPEPPSEKKASKRSEALDAAAKKYDDLLASGAPVYAVFARIAGPNQWFPVGPLTTKGSADKAILGAEKALLDAVAKMYPQLRAEGAKRGLEYGYRLRDGPQMTEAEIRAGGDPFANVVPVKTDDGRVAVQGTNPFAQAMASFEGLFLKKQDPPSG